MARQPSISVRKYYEKWSSIATTTNELKGQKGHIEVSKNLLLWKYLRVYQYIHRYFLQVMPKFITIIIWSIWNITFSKFKPVMSFFVTLDSLDYQFYIRYFYRLSQNYEESSPHITSKKLFYTESKSQNQLFDYCEKHR